MTESCMRSSKKGRSIHYDVRCIFLGQSIETGNRISLALELESEEEIQKIYDAFSQSGSVLMELQDTFWGAKYAKVKDCFDVIWDLNYTKSVSIYERKKRRTASLFYT
ncbi:hypothetical protein GCM10020331_070490 [Ectobacillus funiculus]